MGALLALLVAGGVLVVVNATGDGGDGSGDDKRDGGGQPGNVAESLWRTEPLPEGGDDFVSAVNNGQVWVGQEVVVLLTGSGMWGFDQSSGEELWKLKDPEGLDVMPCSASPDANAQGIGAVLYRPADDRAEEPNCTSLAVVDTAAGEVIWQKDLGEPGDSGVGDLGGDVRVTVGDEAINASLVGRVHRFAIEDGEELPLPEASPSPCPGEPVTTWHTDTVIVLHHNCHSDDEDGSDRITAFDADTLDTMWTSPVENRVDPHLLAGEPVAFSVSRHASDDAWLWTYDDEGEVSGEIPVDSETQTFEDFVTDSLVITRVSSPDATLNVVRGFDPRTGTQLWETELGPRARLVGEPDEEPVVTYDEVAADGVDDAHVAWLDPADGALTGDITLSRYSRTRCCSPYVQDVAFTDDTLYVVGGELGGEVRLEALARD
ncbi:PQQ-binding-like beta-propeller repeat protein [Streptomyces sp. B6B3]|uniref:outer membrane protein assembly factor BamB family protein n=1 Tax=Streptomyces sp. B6B3 TaxID=3153570 RepID=UPI00325E43F0